MNAITTTSHGSALVPTDMRSAMDLATMMARAKLVPSHLQDKPGDCLLVIEQAMRWGMSPFAVAQSTSVISGKLMFEGKLVSAAIHASGILSARMAYEFEGEGAQRAVVASATIRGEDKPRTIRVTLADAKTSNGMWTKQPDQQLVYFATRAWARRHTPEVMLGVYSPEEFEAPRPRDNFAGTTIEAHPEPMTAGQIVNDEIPAHAIEPKKRTVREVARDRLVGCQTPEQVQAVADMPQVKKALVEAPEDIRDEIGGMLSDAMARVMASEDEAVKGEVV